jgi:hypothetical protein
MPLATIGFHHLFMNHPQEVTHERIPEGGGP